MMEPNSLTITTRADASRLFPMVLFVFVGAFVARLLMTSVLDSAFEINKEGGDLYSDLATSLLDGRGYRLGDDDEVILWRAPLYPAYLAIVYAVSGIRDFVAVQLSQVLLDAMTATLLWLAAVRYLAARSAMIAVLLYALYPLSAYYSLRAYPESMFTLSLVLVVYLWMLALHSGNAGRYFWVGIAVGVSALIKPSALGLAPFLAICGLWIFRPSLGLAVKRGALLIIGAAILVSPWTFRNYQLTGQFIPVATGAGYTFWVGNNIVSGGREDDELDGAARREYERQRESVLRQHGVGRRLHGEGLRDKSGKIIILSPELDRIFAARAWRNARDNPVETIKLFADKARRLWFDIYDVGNRWAQGFVYAVQGLLLALALYGVAATRAWRNWLYIVLCPILYFVAVHTLSVATLRYSIPLFPILALLATAGLHAFVLRYMPGLGRILGTAD